MITKTATIENGSLRVTFADGSFHLYSNDNQMTYSFGLYSNVTHASAVYDSFEQRWTIEETADDQMTVRYSYEELPVDEQWHVSIRGGLLTIAVDVCIKDQVADLPFSLVCLLKDDYNRWSNASQIVPFEDIPRKGNEWRCLWEGRPKGGVISCMSDVSGYPDVFLSVDAREFFYNQAWIGNTDFYLNARALRFEKTLVNNDLKPVWVKAFRGSIITKKGTRTDSDTSSRTESLRLGQNERVALLKTGDDAVFSQLVRRIQGTNPSCQITAFVQEDYAARLKHAKESEYGHTRQRLYRMIPLQGYHATSFRLSYKNLRRMRAVAKEACFDKVMVLSDFQAGRDMFHRRARLLACLLRSSNHVMVRAGLWQGGRLSFRQWFSALLLRNRCSKLIDGLASSVGLVVMVCTCVFQGLVWTRFASKKASG